MIELGMTRATAAALSLRPLSAADRFSSYPSIIVKDERGGLWIWPIDAKLLQERRAPQ